MRLFIIAALAAALCGCASNSGLSPVGEQVVKTTARIAVRRAVLDSPRYIEKARNVRAVIEAIGPLEKYTTVDALRAVADAEIAKLGLSELDRADANDLLDLFDQLLREQIKGNSIAPDAVVKVRDLVNGILDALPVL